MFIAVAFALFLSALTAGLADASRARAPQVLDRLSEPGERRENEVQPPRVVMDLLGIRPGLVIGEVGAGRGRLTVHLADRVGDKGRVYANDVDAAALAYLRQRCIRLGISNVEIVQGATDDARLPVNALDAAIMAWVYHHVDQRVALLKSVMPSLKPWGIVAMVEPTPATTEPGLRALTRQSVEADASAAGFRLEAVIEGRLKADNVFVLRPLASETADSRDPAKVRALWLEYVGWRKTATGSASPRDWAVQLERKGMAAAEVRRRLQIVRSQYSEQPEGIEMIFDASFGKPLTGDPQKDGFKTAPNTFLVEAASTLKAGGEALDVGAGMGRNAIHLGTRGWTVTAIDLRELFKDFDILVYREVEDFGDWGGPPCAHVRMLARKR